MAIVGARLSVAATDYLNININIGLHLIHTYHIRNKTKLEFVPSCYWKKNSNKNVYNDTNNFRSYPFIYFLT